MKKVLAIAPYSYLPYYSGGQKFIAKFLEHLAQNTALTVISVPANDQGLIKNYTLLPILKKSFSRYYDQTLIKKIVSLIEKEKFDAIIWEHPYLGWLAKKIKRKTGIRTIIHTHNIEYQRFRSLGKWWWPILRMYERKCLQHADAVFFITEADRSFAVDKWKIPHSKTLVVPFGVDQSVFPNDKKVSTELIQKRHVIPVNAKLLLFNGLLNYKPNLDALRIILEKINPELISQNADPYRIIICGKGLPAQLNGLRDHANIIYAGFVEDIDTYFKAADIFLNPVQSGGGIKTKMVEAIAFGATVISTQSGAAGMDRSIGGEKLQVVADNDWTDFTQKIITFSKAPLATTPESFYEEYGWNGIMRKVALQLNA